MARSKWDRFWKNHWDEVVVSVAIVLSIILILVSQGII
jgi:hypothetical protein